jgi:hypothetical protein
MADLHTSQITRSNAKTSQSAFTSRFLVTNLKNWDSSASRTQILSSQPPVQNSCPPGQSHIATDDQSISQSWCRAPIWGSWPAIYYCLTVTVLLLWGALSDERTGLSFVRVIVFISKSQSKSHCDWQSVSKSWCPAPSGAHDQICITIWQLQSCFCGAPSLTRGRVCRLYMLLALASTVFLGSESLESRDSILLSQIWDFPFCLLLRFAGSR